jgi:hypothetical protein
LHEWFELLKIQDHHSIELVEFYLEHWLEPF